MKKLIIFTLILLFSTRVLPAKERLLVQVDKDLYSHESGRWIKVIKNNFNSGITYRLNEKLFTTYWHKAKFLTIYDAASGKTYKFNPGKLRMTAATILGATLDGIAFISDIRFTGGAIAQWSIRKNTAKILENRRGAIYKKPSKNGSYVYCIEPSMGADESDYFIDFIKGSYHSLYLGNVLEKAKRIIARGHFINPLIVDKGKHVIYWSMGHLDRGARKQTWKLYSYNVQLQKTNLIQEVPVKFRTRDNPPFFGWFDNSTILYNSAPNQWKVYNLQSLRSSEISGYIKAAPQQVARGKGIVLAIAEKRNGPPAVLSFDARSMDKTILRKYMAPVPMSRWDARHNPRSGTRGHRLMIFTNEDMILLPESHDVQNRNYLIVDRRGNQLKRFGLKKDEQVLMNILNVSYISDSYVHQENSKHYGSEEPFMLITDGKEITVVAIPDMKIVYRAPITVPLSKLSFASFVAPKKGENYLVSNIGDFIRSPVKFEEKIVETVTPQRRVKMSEGTMLLTKNIKGRYVPAEFNKMAGTKAQVKILKEGYFLRVSFSDLNAIWQTGDMVTCGSKTGKVISIKGSTIIIESKGRDKSFPIKKCSSRAR